MRSGIKNQKSKIEHRAFSIERPLIAHLIFWPIATAGLLLDLWSKKAVFAWLQTRPGFNFSLIDGFCRLVIRENPGAAFGIAAGQRWLLILVSVIALIIIFCVFFFAQPRRKLTCLVLALFVAGVLGNLHDRLFYDGKVRDFIDIYYRHRHWPAFNVADAMLCIAVALCVLSITTAKTEGKKI